jgi:hypothetical protein
MSWQRRRGREAKIWKQKAVIDNRGNTLMVADADGPYVVTVAQVPERSARAEVPGQAEINVIRIIVDPEIPDVGLWSRVELDGRVWDVVSPPGFHHGTRTTRHWSINLRERP